MPTDPITPAATPPVDAASVAPPVYAELILRPDGKLIFQDIVVGKYEHSSSSGLLTLNLGWCREAGLHVTCLSDPEVDRSRSGIVLER